MTNSTCSLMTGNFATSSGCETHKKRFILWREDFHDWLCQERGRKDRLAQYLDTPRGNITGWFVTSFVRLPAWTIFACLDFQKTENTLPDLTRTASQRPQTPALTLDIARAERAISSLQNTYLKRDGSASPESATTLNSRDSAAVVASS